MTVIAQKTKSTSRYVYTLDNLKKTTVRTFNKINMQL